MLWLHLAMITMICTVGKTFLAKHLLHHLSATTFVVLDLLSSLLLVLPFLYWAQWETLTGEVLFYLVLTCLPASFSLIFLSKATQSGEVSEVAPLLVLVPAISALVAPFITGETLSPMGWLGVLTVLVGGYLLKLREIKHPLEPFLRLKTEPSSRYVMVSVALSVLTVNIQKLAVLKSSALTTMVAQMLLLSLFMIPLVLYGARSNSLRLKAALKNHWPLLLTLGVVSTVGSLSLLYAYQFGGKVAYVLSIKRMSVIFVAFIGMISLGESVRVPKVIGVLIMTLGGVFLYQN